MTKYVEFELLNHRVLRHPHVIEFKVRSSFFMHAQGNHATTPATTLAVAPTSCVHLLYFLCMHSLLASQEVFATDRFICIVMEYAGGGSLFNYVQRAGRLREAAARWFFQQLVLALDYIHKKGVVVRDVKLENALLQASHVY